MSKSEIILFRLTPEELIDLVDRAAMLGVTRSEFIRQELGFIPPEREVYHISEECLIGQETA